MSADVFVHGQRWQAVRGEHRGASSWSICALHVDRVGLTGPGPCRSYMEVSPDELLANWTKVADPQPRRAR